MPKLFKQADTRAVSAKNFRTTGYSVAAVGNFLGSGCKVAGSVSGSCARGARSNLNPKSLRSLRSVRARFFTCLGKYAQDCPDSLPRARGMQNGRIKSAGTRGHLQHLV